MALTPCHMAFQVYRRNSGHLDMVMHQRSADLFLGVPFNIASYALLLKMLAHSSDNKPGKLTITFGDAHIYLNHLAQCKEMVSRYIKKDPILDFKIDTPKDINLIDFSHLDLKDYNPHAAIKGKVSI